VAGAEYQQISTDFPAYDFNPDRLTEKSALSSTYFAPKSRARLMEDEADDSDIDSWMEDDHNIGAFSNELLQDELVASSSSLITSRISKNQLSLHLEGSTQSSQGCGSLDINTQRRLPNMPGEPYGNQYRYQYQYQYHGPKEEEPDVRPLDKKLLKKTGTTIAGCCVGQHVILAADTRATEGTMVADKRCQKLHLLANNAWCAGAGTSADLDHLTKECLYAMSLQTLMDQSIGNGNRSQANKDLPTRIRGDGDDSIAEEDLIFLGKIPVDQLCRFFRDRLFRAKGSLGANLILGGVYDGKAHLRALHPHGSMDIDLPFTALGSGGLAAMGILEEGYANVQTVDDGIKLCERAILAGIKNDLGSGSQVDVCVIYPDGTSRMERCTVPEEELTNDDVEQLRKSIEDGVASGEPSAGANGFGNLAFAIQTKKTLLKREDESAQARTQEWNRILGISTEDKQ